MKKILMSHKDKKDVNLTGYVLLKDEGKALVYMPYLDGKLSCPCVTIVYEKNGKYTYSNDEMTFINIDIPYNIEKLSKMVRRLKKIMKRKLV